MTEDRKELNMSAVDALLAVASTERTRIPLPDPDTRKRLRTSQGLTQSDVASAFKVKSVTVSSWETGRSEPRGDVRRLYAELLRRIAERLGESTEWEGTDDDQD